MYIPSFLVNYLIPQNSDQSHTIFRHSIYAHPHIYLPPLFLPSSLPLYFEL